MLLIILSLVALGIAIFLFINRFKKSQVRFYVKPEKDVDLVYSNDLSGCRIVIEIDGVWFFSDLYLDERDALKDCQQLNKSFKGEYNE